MKETSGILLGGGVRICWLTPTLFNEVRPWPSRQRKLGRVGGLAKGEISILKRFSHYQPLVVKP